MSDELSSASEKNRARAAQIEELQKEIELQEKLFEEKFRAQEVSELNRIRSQNSRRFYSLFLAVIGLAITMVGYLYSIERIQDLTEFFARNYLTFMGAGAALLGVVSLLNSSNKVADVDFLRRATRKENNLNPQAAWPFPVGGKSELEAKDFKGTVAEMTSVLQAQAETYDEKASTLLDKGILYAGGGIVFFLVSIIGWQTLFHFVGYKPAHLFGVVSCGSLFIAIEIISAWFLKQYRNFTESSTELLKIKSMFDKFLLLKLASEESPLRVELEKQLGNTLAREIMWPEKSSGSSKGSIEIKSLNEILSLVQKLVKESKSD